MERERTSSGIRGLRRALARSQILLLLSSPRPSSPFSFLLFLPQRDRWPSSSFSICPFYRGVVVSSGFIAVIEWKNFFFFFFITSLDWIASRRHFITTIIGIIGRVITPCEKLSKTRLTSFSSSLLTKFIDYFAFFFHPTNYPSFFLFFVFHLTRDSRSQLLSAKNFQKVFG